MQRIARRSLLAAAPAALTLAAWPARAAPQYDPGASDTEIKIGNIMPYSGPASAYGVVGKTEARFFSMINDEGGINGRKITFLSYDDGYSPPKTVEQARRLVESDQVLLIFSSLGTPTNTAIHKYMNQKKVPQLFVLTGATKWGDPKHFPWTIGWQANYQSEARIYAAYILEHHSGGKVGVLYQNDDYGKDYLKGVKDGLGDKAKSMIVSEAPYETADTTVDSQIVALKASGANIIVDIATPKFAAQAIRKIAELGWQPVHILNVPGASVGATLKPAGLENAKGILSAGSFKDPTDPRWQDDAGFRQWTAFMDKYYPEGDKTDAGTVTGYSIAQTLVQVLKQCDGALTRENVMKQAANLEDLELPMLLPGIRINTSSTDFSPIKQMQMRRFDGEHWQLFGPVITGAVHD